MQGQVKVSAPTVPCYLDSRELLSTHQQHHLPKERTAQGPVYLVQVREVKGNNGWDWDFPQGAWTPAFERSLLLCSCDISIMLQGAFLSRNLGANGCKVGGYFHVKSYKLSFTVRGPRPTDS